MATYDEIKQQTITALEAGDFDAAFRGFRGAIARNYRLLDGSESQFIDAFDIFAQISNHFANDEFVGKVRAVVAQPSDVQSLYDLGYMLYEEGLPDIGATVLARADEVAPGTPAIISELVTSLEATNQCSAAVDVLQKYPQLTSSQFFPAYQLAFNSVMSGQLDTAQSAFETASKLATTDDDVFMHKRIQGFLDRATTLGSVTPLDMNDLRGWHYVTTGGLLTHVSPFGYPEPMRGRYAMLQDSISTIRHGILDLHRIIQRKQLNIDRVVALNDRDSQIVGSAVAKALELPLQPWSSTAQASNTVVVAYDLSAIDDLTPYERLRTREPGELLFSHALCWVRSCPISPDVVTLLHQFNTAPWEPQMRHDPEATEPTYSDTDERPASVIADEIVSATADPNEGGDEDAPPLTDAFLDAISEFPTRAVTREIFWESSPVKSAQFL